MGPERTAPKAAGVAGIVFAVLLITSLSLLWISVPAHPAEAGEWLPRHWKTVGFALNLVPFAGIAFLWFLGVLRDRMGTAEDRFFATVFLGSGLLYLALLFAASAVAGGVLLFYGAMPDKVVESGIYSFGRMVSYQLLNVYAMKMAGVFMISGCTASLRTAILPRWIVFLGYALALLLLLNPGYFQWVPLVFPLWVLLVSGNILVANLSARSSP